MTNNQKKVLEGFNQLSESEKREVFEFLIKFMHGNSFEKARLFSNLNESARTVGITGDNSCPCCGKS